MKREDALIYQKPISRAAEAHLLSCLPKGLIRQNVPLSAYTSFGIGGSAHFFLDSCDASVLALAIMAARQAEIPTLYLGNGSNLLIPDKGLNALVITQTRSAPAPLVEGCEIHACAGISTKLLCRAAQGAGLGGLSFASGIPASVGGACAMNAGAYGEEISQTLIALECLTDTGELIQLDKGELDYGYRKSRVLSMGLLILKARFRLRHESPDIIAAEMTELSRMRREKQPLSDKSAGSFFKRPEGHFAGALIERAGLKGFRIGDAMVSPLHAGFIVNKGSASAGDVVALARHVRKMVLDSSGVLLEPEVRIFCPEYYEDNP